MRKAKATGEASGIAFVSTVVKPLRDSIFKKVLGFILVCSLIMCGCEEIPSPTDTPIAPSNLIATVASSNQIDLAWQVNSDNESGFEIERKIGTEDPWTQIAAVGSNISSYSDTALAVSTTYYYRIRAYNLAGYSEYSSEACCINVPIFKQCDSRWGSNQLGTCSSATICSHGCAVTGVAMILRYYGVDTDPGDFNTWLKNNLGYTGGCEIQWVMAAYKISGHAEWAGKYTTDPSDWGTYTADLSTQVKWEIDHGYPCVGRVNGHFVVITGHSDSLYSMNDPGYDDSTISQSSITAIYTYHKVASTEICLTISSTAGGSVITPGEGTYTYDSGTVVNLVAEAEDGYWFVQWTGDADTIDDVNASATSINMNDHCSITAKFAPNHFEAIWDWYDLDAIRNHLDGSYILMNDLDSTTPGYEELVSPVSTGGIGWQPIGNVVQPFIGTFDGQGYEISNLFIHRPVTDSVGLFAYVGVGGVLENISLVDTNVTGSSDVGALMGKSDRGAITNCYCTGAITGFSRIGGLIGRMSSTNMSSSYATGSVIGSYSGGLVGESSSNIIDDSYSTCIVTGGSYIGGLIGKDIGSTVTNCWSSGNVSGAASFVGGMIGFSDDGTTVSNSYATGTVTGSSYDIGGLIGALLDSTVSNSYATGSVNGFSSGYRVGGLIGTLWESLLTNSYATGSVTSGRYVGGLVGSMDWSTVTNSYSTGSVSGDQDVGGLVGYRANGPVSNSFWDTETSGQTNSAGGAGRTTDEMQDVATFQNAGWHIISVAPGESNPVYLWNIVDDVTYPFLSWQSVS